MSEYNEALIEKTPREARPTYTFEDGNIYTGEWKGCIRDGQGFHQRVDGGTYEG